MKPNIILYFLLLMVACVTVSCDDDEQTPPQSAAEFTASATTAKVDEEIQFTNASENATSFLWSFGDGTTSKQVSPKKSYQSSGKFVVSLVSTGAGGSTISNLEITVIPDAAFSVEGDDYIALSNIQFTNESKGATSYLWSFGNPGNSTSTEENPVFSYLTPGTYTVTLTATSAFGETEVSKEITVSAASPEVYFIEYNEGLIRKLALDGSGTVSNFIDITGKGGVGMAYDDANGKVYFSDFEVTGEGKIWRVNLDGTDLEAIVTGLIEPYGITLDVEGGKIYWADEWDEEDGYTGHISRANLDGTEQENLVSMVDAQFRAVSLDVENNKMYFYEVYNEDLYVADLDGSNATPIVSGVYGYAIAVDTENNKIYFDDQNDAQLKRANLDGSSVEMVDDTDTRIYGISIDNENNKLYWSGRDSGEIYKSDLDGSNQETLKSELASPRGMFLRK